MPEQRLLTRCPYAYFLLEYIADDGTSELVWNSLDADPPLTIPSPHDLPSHLFGGYYRPAHVPKVGDRIFVALTDIRARATAIERLDWEVAQEHAEQPEAGESLEERYQTREEALEALELDVRENRRGIDLLVVTHGYLEHLAFVRSGPQEQARLRALDLQHNLPAVIRALDRAAAPQPDATLERDEQTLPDRGTQRYVPTVTPARPEVQITGFGAGERPTARDASARADELQTSPIGLVRELGRKLRTTQPPKPPPIYDVKQISITLGGVRIDPVSTLDLEVTPIPMVNGRPLYRDRQGEPLSEADYIAHKRQREYVEVGRMAIGSVVVATSWLGYDNANQGPPHIFETMVFERVGFFERRTHTPAKGYTAISNRYATLADAELGHAEVCAIVALQEAADGKLD